MQCDFNLLYYELFKILKTIIILEKPFKHKKKNFFYDIFYMSYHHDLKLETETKCYFQYNLNIHILS